VGCTKRLLMKIGYLMQAGAPDIRTIPLSGPAAHVWHVCKELDELGHQVSLLAVWDQHIWVSSDLRSFRPVEVHLDRGVLRQFERGVRRLQTELKLPYLHLFDSLRFALACQQELSDCDLFYERMGWMGCGGAIASRHGGQPLVLEVNGDHLAEYEMYGVAPQGIQRSASLRMMHWATHQAAWVVATGDGWRRKFVDRWQYDAARTTVVENGSAVVDLLARNDLAAFHSSADTEAGVVRLAYLGAFEPWHGIRVLLDALVLAVQRTPNVHLELIGDGPLRPEIEHQIAAHSLEHKVTLHGFLAIDQAAPILARCEVALSPYCGRVEYSGLKLLDYKAAGLVTIASGESGEPAVIRHAQTGWIVPPCDVEQLAQAMVTLVQDDLLRHRIGQAARMDAEGQHSWCHTAQQLQAIFQQVLST
jgi:glycosyltransferase involved in cell wall biosynthesis